VKIGIGRVRVKGNWRYWTEILKEMEEEKVIGEAREDERKGGGREDTGEERKERKERIGMDKDRIVGKEERQNGREEMDGGKGMEKNLE